MNESASEAQRRAVVDGVCRGQGWRASRSRQLAEPCECGAVPTTWCRRRGRAVAGFLHPNRGAKRLAGSTA